MPHTPEKNTEASKVYDSAFFLGIGGDAATSAGIMVSLLMQLLKPASVIDVGCGTGEWLAAFKRNGVSRIRGIDGNYVDRKQLVFSQDDFSPCDLTQLKGVNDRFDLALSLEVAEHLPEAVADQFIKTLCSLAPVVAFSAAVPGQGGVQHVNEQWPDYWATKFKNHNYLVVDAVRHRVWTDDRIAWYYRQNLLLYVHAEMIENYNSLCHDRNATREGSLGIVHPGMYKGLLRTTSPEFQSIKTATRLYLRALRCFIQRQVREVP